MSILTDSVVFNHEVVQTHGVGSFVVGLVVDRLYLVAVWNHHVIPANLSTVQLTSSRTASSEVATIWVAGRRLTLFQVRSGVSLSETFNIEAANGIDQTVHVCVEEWSTSSLSVGGVVNVVTDIRSDGSLLLTFPKPMLDVNSGGAAFFMSSGLIGIPRDGWNERATGVEALLFQYQAQGRRSNDTAAALIGGTGTVLGIAVEVFVSASSGGGGGGGSGGHIIADEGVALPAQPILNFVGSGVVVTDGVGETIVDITGGGGGGIPLAYLDVDGTLGANSDVKVATQKATKTYADAVAAVAAAATSALAAAAAASDASVAATAAANLAAGLATKVTANAPITGATKTKISYDAKGLVTGGADATTADINDSTNRRYVTDADLTDIGNLSGTNTGDQAISLTGDVTGGPSAGAIAATIPNDTVNFARMQNITTDRLIGRDTAATGDPEEITVGGGLEFTGSSGIQRSALTGDVTASAGSGATTVAPNAVAYSKMQDFSATSRVLGRKTAGAGDPEELTASEVLDFRSTTRGAVLYKGATTWDPITPGTTGQVLVSNGAGADPTYQTISGGGTASVSTADAIAGATVNLTTEGTIDWYAGGTANPVNPGTSAFGVAHTKMLGGHRIIADFRWMLGGISSPTSSTTTSGVTYSAANVADCEAGSVVNSNSRAAWSSAAANGMLNRGFGCRIPAATATRTLKIYWANGAGTSGVATITATLDDGTTSSTTVNYDAANLYRVATITFAGAGQDCTVTIILTTQTAAGASLSFMCATLA